MLPRLSNGKTLAHFGEDDTTFDTGRSFFGNSRTRMLREPTSASKTPSHRWKLPRTATRCEIGRAGRLKHPARLPIVLSLGAFVGKWTRLDCRAWDVEFPV